MKKYNLWKKSVTLVVFIFLISSGTGICGFDPPENLSIERTWSMIAYGETVGMIRAVRQVVKENGELLVRDKLSGMVGIAEGVQMNSVESSWVGAKGLQKYEATFKETNKKDIISLKGDLVGEIFVFSLKMTEDGPSHSMEFMKDYDYHWSTAYINFGAMNFKKDKKYKKKILDIYHLESRNVEVVYLGDEKVEQAGHTLNCHKVKFDYGTVKGIMWIGKDELGYFLVKETAKAEEGPFQLYMDEYNRKTLNTTDKKQTSPKKKSDDSKKEGFGF